MSCYECKHNRPHSDNGQAIFVCSVWGHTIYYSWEVDRLNERCNQFAESKKETDIEAGELEPSPF